MERIKKYKTLSDFLSERDKGRVYEGYVIGYGYAFYESVAIKPPHLIHNDSICSRYVPYEMSFFQTMWQQNLDRSPEAIMESFGDNNEYLIRGLVREQNGMQRINMGYGEILEVPVEGTTISIGMSSSTNEFTLSVKSVAATGSIERTTTMKLDDFHVIFDNPNWTPRLTSVVETNGISWVGSAGAIWGITQSLATELGGGAKAILENRGAYMPRGQIFKSDIPVTVRTPVVNINTTSKVLNGVRVVGKVAGAAGAVVTASQIIDDLSDKEFYSAGARVAVWSVAAGAAFIPVAGWAVSLGIGVADAIWGERFYMWIEEEF